MCLLIQTPRRKAVVRQQHGESQKDARGRLLLSHVHLLPPNTAEASFLITLV